jgi:hypothetical protein
MMNHLSDMTALLTMFSLGVAYIWLSVVVNRSQRAQRLVVEQLKDKYPGKVDQLAAGGGDLDKALRSEVAQRLAGQ